MPMYWKLKYWKSADRKRTIDHISKIRETLAGRLPQRTASGTLLLATWNLRDFDSNKFGHGPRLKESLHYIAEIIAAFDLVALQEINEDMRPFEQVLDLLGPSWQYIATDVTEGLAGNNERMVFLFDTKKVQFKYVAGEIVLPKSSLVDDTEQFARSPFLVRFQSGWFKFNLCTVHLYYGAEAGPKYRRRVEEIEAIASFLKKRAKADGQNYILLGDLNVVSPDDDTMNALKKHGFLLPSDLALDGDLSRWESNMSRDKYYDQIAFYVREDELEMGPSTNNAGVFDYYDVVFNENLMETYYKLGSKSGQWPESLQDRTKYYLSEWRTWQMSDHLPLWVELKIDFTEKYLSRIREGQQPIAPPTPDATES